MFSKFIVNSPWYFFLLSFLAALVFAVLLYFRNKKNTEASMAVLRTLAILRFVAMFFCCLLLLDLFIRHFKNETENPVLLLALDNSSSMLAGKDSATVRKKLLLDVENLQEKLSSKYQVRAFMFGGNSKPYHNPAFTEKETDLDNLMREIDNNFSNQNIGAMVLISDGIYNKGSNPLYSAEKLGFPIYCVATGDTAQVKDLLIQKVNHNEIVYAGNNFPVEVVLASHRLKGRSAKVTLLQNQKVLQTQQLPITAENFAGTVNFTLSAEAPGISRYNVRVVLDETEDNVNNNSQSFVVEVINNKEKILLLAGAPHPDIAAIRDALSASGNYELDCVLYPEEHKPLKAYNLIILHGSSSQQNPVIKECTENNLPFCAIAPKNFDQLPGLRVSNQMNRMDDAEPMINENFGLFNLSTEFRALSKILPAVKVPFGNYQISNSSQSLLTQKIGNIETGSPLLFFTENNGLKTAVYTGDGLWQWRMRDFTEHQSHKLFNELLSKTVQYLVVKSDKSFFRLNAPRIISENSPFEISAEVYNKSYELITEPEVSLELVNADNKKFNYTFSTAGKGYQLNAGFLSPGDYRYVAKVKVNNELIIKEGLLSVKEVVSEKLNTVANHQLLAQLSSRSNGRMYNSNQIVELPEDILKNEQIRPITYTQADTSPLIELKWIFFLILGLLAIEWFFRKRYLVI